MKKVIGITIILVFAVLVLAYLYFSNLNGQNRNNDRLLAEIPADASVIFQYQNDKSLYEIFKDYTVFDTILGSDKKAELSWLKKLMLSSREIAELMEGQQVFLSFHPAKGDSVHFLWSSQLKQNSDLADLQAALSKLSGTIISLQSLSGKEIIKISSSELRSPFYISLDEGIIRAGFSAELLSRAVERQSPKISSTFVKEINLGLKKDDYTLAHLFINFEKGVFLKPFIRRSLSDNLELFGSLSAYTSLDFNYKTDAMMFSGISKISADRAEYIPIYLNQKPVKNTIKQVMPYNTASSITYGISDYPIFKRDLDQVLEARNELDTLKKQILTIGSETGINTDRDLIGLWAKELSTLHLSTSENLAIIKVTDGSKLQFLLDPMSSFYSPSLRKLNYNNLFYYYFGDPLKRYNKPFFTITDNLLILSNSASTLQRFLNDYNSDRFLDKTEAFNLFDQLIADQSNISFVLHLKNAQFLLKNSLKSNYAQVFSSNYYGIKDLYALSYQLTSNGEYFFTNFYTGYKNKLPATELDLFVDSMVSN